LDNTYKNQSFCEGVECLETSCMHHQNNIDVIDYEKSGKCLIIKDYRKDCGEYTPPVFDIHTVFYNMYECEDCEYYHYEPHLDDEPRGSSCRLIMDEGDEKECPEYFEY